MFKRMVAQTVCILVLGASVGWLGAQMGKTIEDIQSQILKIKKSQ